MAKDIYNKRWIIEQSIEVCSEYEKGILTLRALHYQLVSRGMTNDVQHYKRVVSAMIDARWDGLIDFDTFSDLDRSMIGKTEYEETVLEDEIETAKDAILNWMRYYRKNRWENQPYYPEVFIEKKALQGVFEPICNKHDVTIGACKGYPSLTFLYESHLRFKEAIENGKIPIIIYFGDYDPSGEDIPRSIVENLEKFGVEVKLTRVSLNKSQVLAWNLPPAPAKLTDSRTAKWNGLGQVELDAVRPEKLMRMCEDSILSFFDNELYSELKSTESEEKEIYVSEVKSFVNGLE